MMPTLQMKKLSFKDVVQCLIQGHRVRKSDLNSRVWLHSQDLLCYIVTILAGFVST